MDVVPDEAFENSDTCNIEVVEVFENDNTCNMDVDHEHMDGLPDEILEKIFSYFTTLNLSVLEVVCTRWSAVIVRRFFHPFLAVKEFSVAKQLIKEGWNPEWEPENHQNYNLNRKMFRKVTQELPNAWTESMPTLTESVLASFRPGTNDCRATDMAVYKDKLYLGRATCVVEVWCLCSFSLTRVLNDDNEPGPGHISRSCALALHHITLAVSCPSRTKVRLFNTETDEMVNEIETQLGPIYKIVISDRLLICLSGWSLLIWKIDSAHPSTVRAKFQGVFPDYPSIEEFSNWLEVHSAVINSLWLVTHATRRRSGPPPLGIPRQRSVCFLQIRRLGPDGHLGRVLRPERSALSEDVMELSCLALSDKDILAFLVMVNIGNNLKYLINVINVENGDEIASIQSPSSSILGSVDMPVVWRGDHLYMKQVPKLFDEDGEISLTRWDRVSGSITAVPGVSINSSNDLLLVEEARLVQVSTRLIKQEILDESDDEEENEEHSFYTVKSMLYDFWNVMEE